MKKVKVKAKRQQNSIKSKFRLKKDDCENITKRVENFLYLSKLYSLQTKQEAQNEAKSVERSVKRIKYRPMTSRGNKLHICTDLQIISLASNSPRKDLGSARSYTKGKATFYTESKTPTNIMIKNVNIVKSSKHLNSSRNMQINRPFTAKLFSSEKNPSSSHFSAVKLVH